VVLVFVIVSFRINLNDFAVIPGQAQAVGPLLSVPAGRGHPINGQLLLTDVGVGDVTLGNWLYYKLDSNAQLYPKSDFIATGKVRWVFHDYPLDQIALLAAQVARYLPVDRYEPFVDALFATQDRWAFARDANHTEELWKTAGLAGMSRATFDKAVADDELKNWIVQQRQIATDKWQVDSTPSFVINGTKYAGEMNIDAFRKLVPDT